jgi:Bacterial Ig-like domain (group 3)
MTTNPFARAAAVFATVAVATLGLVGLASPAQAEPVVLGTLALDPASGPVGSPADALGTNPMTVATTSGSCPEGFGTFASLRVGPVGGPYSLLSRVGSDANYDQVESFSLAANRSMARALGATPADGTYEVVIECSHVVLGVHPLRYSTLVTVTGGTWQVVAPAATETKLKVRPEWFSHEGQQVRLTAKVRSAAAAGEVEFFTGTTSLGTATVVDGNAQLSTTALPAGVNKLTATFTPDDPRVFQPSTSKVVWHFVIG